MYFNVEGKERTFEEKFATFLEESWRRGSSKWVGAISREEIADEVSLSLQPNRKPQLRKCSQCYYSLQLAPYRYLEKFKHVTNSARRKYAGRPTLSLFTSLFSFSFPDCVMLPNFAAMLSFYGSDFFSQL